MGFKILNISTGCCYNGAIGSEDYPDLPDSIYGTRREAEEQITMMLLGAGILRGCILIREHLEIIKS